MPDMHRVQRPEPGPNVQRPEPGPNAPIDEIEADLERTRHELGDTAQALAAKLDVPGQARAKIDQTKHRVSEKAEPVRQNAVPIAAATGVLVLVVLLRRRRHRRSELR